MIVNSEDKEILEIIQEDRLLGDSSLKSYEQVIKKYTTFNGMTMKELIEEADKEESADDKDQRIEWKNRQIKKRLIKFRSYLYKNYKLSTADFYFSTLLTIYRTFEIELHPLPYFSKKGVKKNPPIYFKDLPTKKNIQDAIKISDIFIRDFILFTVYTGSGRKESRSINVRMFLESTTGYHTFHKHHNIQKAIKEILEYDNVIATWYLKRIKTNKYYYTFQGPESVHAMCYDLLSRYELTLETKIFKIDNNYLSVKFHKINDQLDLGKVGSYIKFRPHMLRKYHSTHLKRSPYMDMDMVDSLQGRSKSKIRSSYFIDNPEDLKEAYRKSLTFISINDDGIIKSEEIRRIEKQRDEAIREKEELERAMDIKIKIRTRELFNEYIEEFDKKYKNY